MSFDSIEHEEIGDFESDFTKQEESFEIHKVLHRLKEPYKEVFSLRIFGELSFLKIGEIFQKTEGWARITYHRAKIKIKENYNANGSYIDENGYLVESFGLIPLAYLFGLMALVSGIIIIVNTFIRNTK